MKLTVADIQSIIAEKIPADRVVPEHTEDSHYYRDTFTSDPAYASVTTKSGILDMPHLKKWAAKLATEKLLENWNQVNVAREAKDEASLDLLKKQAIFAHRDVFQEAGDIGTQGHEIVEMYLKDWINDKKQPFTIKPYVIQYLRKKTKLPDPPVDPRLYAIVRSAEAFCNDFFVEPVATELLVSNSKYKFAGQLDALMLVGTVQKEGKDPECEHSLLLYSKSRLEYRCLKCELEVKKRFALVDWKTSNSIDKVDYALQVSAYKYAFKEMTGILTNLEIIVRLDKKHRKYEVRKLINTYRSYLAFRHLSKVYDWLVGDEPLVKFMPRERLQLKDLNNN